MIIRQNMKENKALDLWIYSLDNELTVEEQNLLDAYLKKGLIDPIQQEEILAMRNDFALLKLDAKQNFATAVLEKIDTETSEDTFAIIVKLMPRVAAACIIVTMLAVLGTYFTEDNLSLEAIIGIQDLNPEDAYSLIID